MNSPALAEQFTAAEFTPKQSDALIYAFQSRHEKLVTREHFDRELGLTREYLALIRERMDSHAERMDALTEHMKREHALTRERMDALINLMDSNAKQLEGKLIAAMSRTHVHLMVTILAGIGILLTATGIAVAVITMGES